MMQLAAYVLQFFLSMSVLGWVGGCRVFIIIITCQNFELS